MLASRKTPRRCDRNGCVHSPPFVPTDADQPAWSIRRRFFAGHFSIRMHLCDSCYRGKLDATASGAWRRSIELPLEADFAASFVLELDEPAEAAKLVGVFVAAKSGEHPCEVTR